MIKKTFSIIIVASLFSYNYLSTYLYDSWCLYYMQCFLYYRAAPGHRAARSVEVMISQYLIYLDLISRSEKKSKDIATSSRWTSANS